MERPDVEGMEKELRGGVIPRYLGLRGFMEVKAYITALEQERDEWERRYWEHAEQLAVVVQQRVTAEAERDEWLRRAEDLSMQLTNEHTQNAEARRLLGRWLGKFAIESQGTFVARDSRAFLGEES